MRKGTILWIYPLTLMGVFLVFASSCSKDDDDDNAGSITVLSTTEVTDIAQTTAKSGGNIISDGGNTVTARGVCWSTNENPTIEDNITEDGTDAGSFTSSITNLEPNTTYHVRAYATNRAGTGYGSAMSFTTQERSTVSIFTDPRDGNAYQTVTIGTQVWMAENLRYLPSVVGPWRGSITAPYYYVYDYDGTDVNAAKGTSNYSTYGVLYNWIAAVNACPAGWHLPSNDELTEMENYLADNGYNYDGTTGGGRDKIAKAMAATSGWNSNSNNGAVGNTDYAEYRNKSGFTALPGGYVYSGGSFDGIGHYGFWWSSTESNASSSWAHYLSNASGSVGSFYYGKYGGHSVRCLRD